MEWDYSNNKIFFGRRNDSSYVFSQIYVIYTATYIRNISFLVIKTHIHTHTHTHTHIYIDR